MRAAQTVQAADRGSGIDIGAEHDPVPKHIITVEGGPGTGKTVIAVDLPAKATDSGSAAV